MPKPTYPRFLFHPSLAPEGKIFGSLEDEQAKGATADAGWVDTPAAFDPEYVAPPEPESGPNQTEAMAVQGIVPQRYPKHLYRRGDPDGAKEVATKEAHDVVEAAEPGVWKETPDPSAWDDPGPVPESSVPKTPAAAPPAESKPTKAAKAPAAAPKPTPLPADPAAPLTDEQKAAFAKASVGDIAAQLETVTSVVRLDQLRDAEQGSSKPRATVLKAIAARKKLINTPAGSTAIAAPPGDDE